MNDGSLGMRHPDLSGEVELDPEEGENSTIESFFDGKEIPSFEEAEKFLIQQALKIYDGNRRKASEALGVSERTLYRKLDQYDLQ